jgi:hypothetical protein
MELLLLIALGYGTVALCRKGYRAQAASRERRQRDADARAAAEQRYAEQLGRRQTQHRRLNGLARNMQLALLQLNQAPDFRRAANFAAHAKHVPIAFRQRQFHRFRGQLVQHLITRLQAGGDPQVLLESLRELLTALGVSEFEADYILEEVERRRPPRREPPRPDFGEELQRSQREHEERMTAIRGLNVESAIREQMLEAERARFERRMVRGEDDRGLDDADLAI